MEAKRQRRRYRGKRGTAYSIAQRHAILERHVKDAMLMRTSQTNLLSVDELANESLEWSAYGSG